MRGKLWWVAGAAALGGQALLSAPAAAVTCVGRTCGRDQGFAVSSCFIRPQGDPHGTKVCWSSEFDLSCQRQGFSVPILCPAGSLGGPSLGAGSSQIATAVGGFNDFLNQVAQPAVPRQQLVDIAADQQAAKTAAGEVHGVHFSEVTTSYEHEAWRLDGSSGATNGGRIGWNHESENGGLWGAAASYQDAVPDSGSSIGLVNLTVDAGHTFDQQGIFRWALHATGSQFSGLADQTLYGGGGQLYFNKPFEGGPTLSGGVILNYMTGSDLPQDVLAVSYGVAYGFPVGPRLAINLEAFGSHLAQPDVDGARNFYLLGGMGSVYLTRHFSMTLGYRSMLGIHELRSNTFTLGASTRW